MLKNCGGRGPAGLGCGWSQGGQGQRLPVLSRMETCICGSFIRWEACGLGGTMPLADGPARQAGRSAIAVRLGHIHVHLQAKRQRSEGW